MYALKVCVVIPVTGSVPWVDRVIEDARQAPAPKGCDKEILVVADICDSTTIEKIRKSTAPEELLMFKRKLGKGGAIRKAYKARMGIADWFMHVDCDGEHRPSENLPKALKAARNGVLLVQGEREKERILMPYPRIILEYLLNCLFLSCVKQAALDHRQLLNERGQVGDLLSGSKLLHTSIATQVRSRDAYPFEFETLYRTLAQQGKIAYYNRHNVPPSAYGGPITKEEETLYNTSSQKLQNAAKDFRYTIDDSIRGFLNWFGIDKIKEAIENVQEEIKEQTPWLPNPYFLEDCHKVLPNFLTTVKHRLPGL